MVNTRHRDGQHMQNFLIFPKTQTFRSTKLLIAFPPSVYQPTIFTPKILLDCQTMHLVPCNGNRMGQTGHKLNFRLIRLHIQTQFPSNQQLPGLLLPRSLSTNSLLYKMIEYQYLLYHTFFDTSKGPSWQAIRLCLMFLGIRTNFLHSYRLHFFIKTSIDNF